MKQSIPQAKAPIRLPDQRSCGRKPSNISFVGIYKGIISFQDVSGGAKWISSIHGRITSVSAATAATRLLRLVDSNKLARKSAKVASICLSPLGKKRSDVFPLKPTRENIKVFLTKWKV